MWVLCWQFSNKDKPNATCLSPPPTSLRKQLFPHYNGPNLILNLLIPAELTELQSGATKFTANPPPYKSATPAIIYRLPTLRMDQEHCTVRTARCHGRSKWEDMFGYVHDQALIKAMYNNSKLLPPPPHIEQQKHKHFKKHIHELKLRIKCFFRRIVMNNTYYAGEYARCPTLMHSQFLPEPQCRALIEEFEPQVLAKFRKLSNEAMNLLREGEYSKMDKALESMRKWAAKMEEKIKQKYYANICHSAVLQQPHWTRSSAQPPRQQPKLTKSIYEQGTDSTESIESESACFDMSVLDEQIRNMLEQQQKCSQGCRGKARGGGASESSSDESGNSDL